MGIGTIAAAVGVSFGGLQAVHGAADQGLSVPRLILHSCAPSGLPYPDSQAEAILGPAVFSPLIQGVVWRAVRRIVGSDTGPRLMMARLSKHSASEWWGDVSPADKGRARASFSSMRSDSGFVNDLRQGRSQLGALRREAISNVRCPALVTASPHDGGVSFIHAEDFADTLPHSTLVTLESPSHLFWLGAQEQQLLAVIGAFLHR